MVRQELGAFFALRVANQIKAVRARFLGRKVRAFNMNAEDLRAARRRMAKRFDGSQNGEDLIALGGNGGQCQRRRAAARVMPANGAEGGRVGFHGVAAKCAMDVKIDEAWHEQLPMKVDNFFVLSATESLCRNFGNLTVEDADITADLDAIRENEPSISEDHTRCQAGLCS
jgi:hypothetical protein